MLDKKPLLILFSIGLLISVVGSNIQVQASEKPEYFFFVHMIAPTSNPVRMQYAQLMEGELPKIGIGAELDLISWYALGPRCTDQEVGMYNEGGYDICIFGMMPISYFPCNHDSLYCVYGKNAIPPTGFNVMYWSSETGKNYNNYRAQESEDLIKRMNTNLNLTEVKSDYREWQKLWYDVMPNILIYSQYEVHAVSTGLYGYDPVKYPLNSIEDMWQTSDFTGTANQVVLASSTGSDTFNPLIATNVHDHYSNNPAFDGLYGNTPSKEAVLPSETDRGTWMKTKYNTTDYMALYPRIAAKMGTYSSDGLSYAIDVKEGVYWHDGEKVDAWDISFSFQAPLIPPVGASQYSYLIGSFGMDNKTAKHGNYSFTVTDENSDGFYEHINFTLGRISPSFETNYVGMYLFPEHILGDPVDHGFNSNGDFVPNEKWNVKPKDWRHHSTTTGRKNDPGGYTGPIGCGSMVFKEYDSTTGKITLQKFKDIKWDNISSQWVSAPGFSHWNIDKLDNMSDIAKVIVLNQDNTLSSMRTGEINILDPYYNLNNIYDELRVEDTIQTVFLTEEGWQSIFLNPKFEQDGIHHLAKKGVRHAISHLVPREDIITYLMNGLAYPVYSPVPHTYWEAISEDELIAYKRSLEASDGTTPESTATTAYDEYSVRLASDWLDTEGYNTTEWREYSYEPPEDNPFPKVVDTTPLILGLLFISVVLIVIYISGYKFLMRKK